MPLSAEAKAKLACLFGGAVWGLFWLPLRALEEAGLRGLWIAVVFASLPAILVLPWMFWRWRRVLAGGIALQVTACLCGASMLLYSISIIYTDVVRAMLLFYLTPVWATILGRVFLGEEITLARVLAIGLALSGMLVIFGLGIDFPAPKNTGDWLGVMAGFLWAVSMVRLRVSQTHSAIDLTFGFFLWSFILGLGIALVISPGGGPSVNQVAPTLPALTLFIVFLVIPGTFLSLWGPKFLSPGLVGLLFMTEIVVGTVSVALLSGEDFGLREGLGAVLIAGASLLESLKYLLARKDGAGGVT